VRCPKQVRPTLTTYVQLHVPETWLFVYWGLLLATGLSCLASWEGPLLERACLSVLLFDEWCKSAGHSSRPHDRQGRSPFNWLGGIPPPYM